MQRTIEIVFVLLLGTFLVVSCGGNAGGDVDGGGNGDAADVADAGGGTPDANLCTGGSLCGQPAQCCPAGNECIDGACLAECTSGVRCGINLDVCCGDVQVCISNACATLCARNGTRMCASLWTASPHVGRPPTARLSGSSAVRIRRLRR